MFKSIPAFAVSLLLLVSTGCATKQLRADLESAQRAQAECQDALTAEQALAEARLAAYRDIAAKMREAFGDDEIAIEIRNGRLVVKLSNAILFDTGKATLKPAGKTALEKIAGVMKAVPERRFLVAGHTDDRPVSEKATEYSTNWELSAKRALSAVYFLQDKGMDPKRMAAAGYGEYQPLVKNDSDANRAKNRRTEIVIMPTLDEIPKLPTEI